MRDVDEPNISPDGAFIAYVVKTTDAEKDKLPGNLWMARWDGSDNRALTSGNKGQSHPRWSPDGKWIAFLSGREDENEVDQLWILPSNGGEAQKFTDLKGSVDDFAWAPDAKRIVLVVRDPDPREPEKKEKEKKTVPPIVIDRFVFKHDIDGYLTQRYSHLQLLDLTSRKIEPLTSGRHNDLLPAWSPSGRRSRSRANAETIPIGRTTGMSTPSAPKPGQKSVRLRPRRNLIRFPSGKAPRPGARTANGSHTFTGAIPRKSNMPSTRSP